MFNIFHIHNIVYNVEDVFLQAFIQSIFLLFLVT